MDRGENNKEHLPPWRFSSANPFLPSSSSSSTTPANHRRETLFPEYHPVSHTNTRLHSAQNYWSYLSRNPNETISSIPEYHPKNYSFRNNMPENHFSYPNFHPSDFLSPENRADSLFLPDNLDYGHQYQRNLNSDFLPDNLDYDQLALNAAMNALTISNSLYPSSDFPSFRHQSAMDLEKRRIESAVNGYLYDRIQSPYRALTKTSGPNYHDILHQIYRSRNNYSPSNTNGYFRPSQRRSYSSLEEIRGRIAAVAMEKEGCSFLQKILEKKVIRREVVEAIFSEIIESVCDVMVDQFGHHVIQDLIVGCNEEEITRIVLAVCSDDNKLMDICLDVHGTRAIQTLLEHLKTREQISAILSVMRPITIILTRSGNGHHVIKKCLSRFSFEDTQYISNDIANNYAELSMDKNGCCVLQTCVLNADEELRDRVIADITSNAFIFSQNLYGNYVVQFLLDSEDPCVRARVIAQLEGRFVSLSIDKYGSNVVEKCFRECNCIPRQSARKCINECSPRQSTRIIRELISSPNFVAVLQDQFGNYVVQKALEETNKDEGSTWNILVERVQSHRRSLHSHPHGKRVLAKSTENKHNHP